MKKVTLVMLALTAVMQLPAQEQGRTLSLEEALEMTLSDNPAIRAAEFNRRAAQQERRAAIGLRMPQIGITGSYAYLGKDIEIDLNNMKAPVQNLAGQILQSGMIPSDYIPSISQMLSGAMAASWALPSLAEWAPSAAVATPLVYWLTLETKYWIWLRLVFRARTLAISSLFSACSLSSSWAICWASALVSSCTRPQSMEGS